MEKRESEKVRKVNIECEPTFSLSYFLTFISYFAFFTFSFLLLFTFLCTFAACNVILTHAA